MRGVVLLLALITFQELLTSLKTLEEASLRFAVRLYEKGHGVPPVHLVWHMEPHAARK